MRVTVVIRALHSQRCGQAVASGLERGGHDVRTTHVIENVQTPYAVCWGWRVGAQLRKAGHEVLVMERGYVGDRFSWYSLGWNGLNGNATPLWHPDDDGARWREHYAALMRPWREPGTGRYVLLIGQVPGDMSLAGQDLTRWYSSTALAAQARYGLPVRFREHPQALARGYNRSPHYTEPATGTLDEALAGAEVCVTYNSNTAVDSVLAGVPAVVDNRGSMAWDVAGHRIGDLVRPERERWAAKLAWRQWRLDEIASGAPFTSLEQSHELRH